jgi:pyridoxamine 5'-phosphate oxidase
MKKKAEEFHSSRAAPLECGLCLADPAPFMNIADLRKEYRRATLDPTQADPDPFAQFATWLDDALKAQLAEPTAMTLATVDGAGRPSVRTVLLKGIDAGEFLFYTNYGSRKGRELDARPQAALLFYWAELERQVRVEGDVRRASAGESDAYYHSRPIGARLSAWASPQSETVADRGVLEQRMREEAARHGEHPARPSHWGGYRVRPQSVEFWQGRQDRLHDRVLYRRYGNSWSLVRLAP